MRGVTRSPHFALRTLLGTCVLPSRAGLLVSCRYTSNSSANPYPYPTHANPSPHQIFHLPRNASLKDVKARYYDLVRIYHPDSPVNRSLPAATVQARFQSISTAYDVLRGRSRVLPSGDTERVDPKKAHHGLTSAMWKAKQRKKAELPFAGPVVSDKWKDRLMLGTIVFTVGAFVAQIYSTRRQTMISAKDYAQARAEARSEYQGSLQRTAQLTLSDDVALDSDRTADKPV